MLPVLISALAALGLALLRLWGCHRQMAEMARVLEETPAESNLRLTMEVNSATARRLCRAMNARLEEGRRLRTQALNSERELRYTMACISHDIRTPPWRVPWAIYSCWRRSRTAGRSISPL